ncbi:hypothetical protein BDY19DRAFT_1051377 [Irpex rosettiformis]|uniref:Uncharacterized protein n=1 Tax=Irpex rosettiformis TaxID=378272 RepID=A0ACB8TQF6_9APHY|nr:hypothetical protein BDY19DRAFT_1051377 [Irpex rosettiformis]
MDGGRSMFNTRGRHRRAKWIGWKKLAQLDTADKQGWVMRGRKGCKGGHESVLSKSYLGRAPITGIDRVKRLVYHGRRNIPLGRVSMPRTPAFISMRAVFNRRYDKPSDLSPSSTSFGLLSIDAAHVTANLSRTRLTSASLPARSPFTPVFERRAFAVCPSFDLECNLRLRKYDALGLRIQIRRCLRLVWPYASRGVRIAVDQAALCCIGARNDDAICLSSRV